MSEILERIISEGLAIAMLSESERATLMVELDNHDGESLKGMIRDAAEIEYGERANRAAATIDWLRSRGRGPGRPS